MPKKDGFNVSPARKSASAALSWQALKIKRGQWRL